MKTRACVIHGKGDVRIETREIGDVGRRQVRVRIGAGGLCGSDIHYFWDGGIGSIRISEPMILGHEVAGTVEAVGAEVTNVNRGIASRSARASPAVTAPFLPTWTATALP